MKGCPLLKQQELYGFFYRTRKEFSAISNKKTFKAECNSKFLINKYVTYNLLIDTLSFEVDTKVSIRDSIRSCAGICSM